MWYIEEANGRPVPTGRLALLVGGQSLRPNARLHGDAAAICGYLTVAGRLEGFGRNSGGRDRQRQRRDECGAERGFHKNGHHFILSEL